MDLLKKGLWCKQDILNAYLDRPLNLKRIISVLKNYDVYECPWMAHMYKDSPSDRKLITRGGFGIRKELEEQANVLSVDETIKRIENNFFDIIYSTCF